MSLIVGDRLVRKSGRILVPAWRSPTQSDIYQMYWYNWFSWWWARCCSKHVGNCNKHIRKKNCASNWLFTRMSIVFDTRALLVTRQANVRTVTKWHFRSTIVAIETQQRVPLYCCWPSVADNIKMFSVATAMQQRDPFVLLPSCNIFITAINNTNV
jgi:hypothetical protein